MNAAPFDTVQGLPVHALLVHATVVAVPVVMLAVLAIAIRPHWRRAYGWYVVGAAVVVVPLVGVTILSGRALKDRLGSSPQILRHENLGTPLIWWTLGVAVVSALLVVVHRRWPEAQKGLVAGIAVVTFVAAAVTFVQVIRTGHAGSVAVWESVVESTSG